METFALTYALDPNKGEVWQLHHTPTGFELAEPSGHVITSFPEADAGHRIRFPSFIASVAHLEVIATNDVTHHFKPEKAVVEGVKAAVAEALGRDPAGAAAVLRKKGNQSLLIGGAMLLGGIGVTVATSAIAVAQPGGGGYLVTTGLIGLGLFNLIRGGYWVSKANQVARTGGR